MTRVLITPDELESLLATRVPLRILDVRWSLAQPDGRADYRSEHIPGAVYVDLETQLTDPERPVSDGRHPLPSTEQLQEAMRSLGVRDGDTVVVYDAWNNMGSSRAWWLLARAGLSSVRVLDGGIDAWRDAGFTTESGDVAVSRGDVSLTRENGRGTLDIDQAADLARRGGLVDVRAEERYRGETEPIDPRAGHIPGAVNVPATQYLSDGRFASPERIKQAFKEAGVDTRAEVGAYCGSGITAAQAALALHEAGIDAAIYPGSWSQWSRHPERPVET